jgi:hypothetical protein
MSFLLFQMIAWSREHRVKKAPLKDVTFYMAPSIVPPSVISAEGGIQKNTGFRGKPGMKTEWH